MIIEEAYTFDDVLLQPAHSKFGPADADVKTFITKNINFCLGESTLKIFLKYLYIRI